MRRNTVAPLGSTSNLKILKRPTIPLSGSGHTNDELNSSKSILPFNYNKIKLDMCERKHTRDDPAG